MLAAVSLSGQDAEFFVDDVAVELGDSISVDVVGLNVDQLVGFQFSVCWDTTVLAYQGVKNIILDGSPAENFNRVQLDSGRLGYLLIDNTLNGFAVADSVRLFTLRFLPVGTQSLTTEIRFCEEPLRFSGMDVDNARIDTLTTDGVVTLGDASGLPSFARNPRFRASPNPFTERLYLDTDLPYGSAATLEILDLRGRLLLQRPVRVNAGKQRIELAGRDFPGAGAFVVRLVTDREQLHRRVIRHLRP